MRLLVVEDYQPLRDSLVRGLSADGYAVDQAADLEEAWWSLRDGSAQDYDAVVLDRMLPGGDGLNLVERIRDDGYDTPVLVLTAMDDIDDRVQGLDAGADDYLIKPFAVPELLARLRRLIRRHHGGAKAGLQLGALSLDPVTKVAVIKETTLNLSPREFQLLEYLLHRHGQVVSRQDLWAHLYDQNSDTISNVLDVLVGRLRRKIQALTETPTIVTHRGQGYRLDTAS